MTIVDDTVRRIVSGAREDMRAVLVPALLGLAGALTGAVGLGFFVASAYFALRTAMGQGLAALLTGAGLALLSLGLLLLARRRMARRRPVDPPVPAPGSQGKPAGNLASQIAFTAAFVLARYLGGDRRN